MKDVYDEEKFSEIIELNKDALSIIEVEQPSGEKRPSGALEGAVVGSRLPLYHGHSNIIGTINDILDNIVNEFDRRSTDDSKHRKVSRPNCFLTIPTVKRKLRNTEIDNLKWECKVFKNVLNEISWEKLIQAELIGLFQMFLSEWNKLRTLNSKMLCIVHNL